MVYHSLVQWGTGGPVSIVRAHINRTERIANPPNHTAVDPSEAFGRISRKEIVPGYASSCVCVCLFVCIKPIGTRTQRCVVWYANGIKFTIPLEACLGAADWEWNGTESKVDGWTDDPRTGTSANKLIETFDHKNLKPHQTIAIENECGPLSNLFSSYTLIRSERVCELYRGRQPSKRGKRRSVLILLANIYFSKSDALYRFP